MNSTVKTYLRHLVVAAIVGVVSYVVAHPAGLPAGIGSFIALVGNEFLPTIEKDL